MKKFFSNIWWELFLRVLGIVFFIHIAGLGTRVVASMFMRGWNVLDWDFTAWF